MISDAVPFPEAETVFVSQQMSCEKHSETTRTNCQCHRHVVIAVFFDNALVRMCVCERNVPVTDGPQPVTFD